MDQIFFNIRPQLGANDTILHQIDRAPKQILQIELHAKIAFGSGAAIKIHHHVNVAAVACIIPCG